MSTTQPDTTPVNPLAGATDTFTVVDHQRTKKDGRVDVPGRLVAPGLAITASLVPKSKPELPDRFCLTHVGTGLSVVATVCAVHIQQTAEVAAAAGIDWTITGNSEMGAAILVSGKAEEILAARRACDARWCKVGDGPEPLSAAAACDTCDWETDGTDEDQWPLTREEATELALDHECPREVKVQAPGSEKWTVL